VVQAGEPDNPIDLRSDSPEDQNIAESPCESESDLKTSDHALEEWYYSMQSDPGEDEIGGSTSSKPGNRAEQRPESDAERQPADTAEKQPASRAETSDSDDPHDSFLRSERARKEKSRLKEDEPETSASAELRELRKQLNSQNSLLLTLLQKDQEKREAELEAREAKLKQQESLKRPSPPTTERAESSSEEKEETGSGHSWRKRHRKSQGEREADKLQ